VNAARAVATIAVALACAAASGARDAATGALSGEQILARAKATFRGHARPPFVVYTLQRRDYHSRMIDLENSYTLKIWCRAADRSALTRKVWNGQPYGAMQHITVAFDELVDPGPPTADIFERALFAKGTPAPEATPLPTTLPTIGGVSISKDYDYRVTRELREGELWHLGLEAIRDPYRNRIDDLWIDMSSFAIRRMRVRDHLYLGMTGQSIDDEFDVRFTERDGLPLLASILGRTAWGQYETEYTYKDVSFPETLPDWYFDPPSYGKHKSEAPT
jgi:hypothetical protein